MIWSTVADAAHTCDVPEHVIRRWIRSGKLRAIHERCEHPGGALVDTEQAERLAEWRRNMGTARPPWARLAGMLDNPR